MQIQDFTLKTTTDTTPWRLFTPKDASKEYCVLWLQGWSSAMDSHREGVERMAQQTGMPFATLDPAGHGKHPTPIEQSTRQQQHEEVVAVFDELKQQGYDKVIVIGGSFGAYMAVLLSAKRPVHTLILRAPANYPDAEFTLPYAKTSSFNRAPEESFAARRTDKSLLSNTAMQAVRAFDGFVYILEHELDDEIPTIVPKRYFAVAKKGNYLIIPNTKHSPKLMPNPQRHFDYIEHVIAAILKAIQLQDNLASS
jgi:esterase/lipase